MTQRSGSDHETGAALRRCWLAVARLLHVCWLAVDALVGVGMWTCERLDALIDVSLRRAGQPVDRWIDHPEQ